MAYICTKFDDCSFSCFRDMTGPQNLKLSMWMWPCPFQGLFVVPRIIGLLHSGNIHTYTHNHFTALWILSGTTWMSWYQKKYSPTHTYCAHQSSLICFFHIIQSTASSLFNPRAWQSFFTISLQVFFGLPMAWHPSLHTPYISSPNHCFLQHMPIPSQPVLLEYRDYVI